MWSEAEGRDEVSRRRGRGGRAGEGRERVRERAYGD